MWQSKFAKFIALFLGGNKANVTDQMRENTSLSDGSDNMEFGKPNDFSNINEYEWKSVGQELYRLSNDISVTVAALLNRNYGGERGARVNKRRRRDSDDVDQRHGILRCLGGTNAKFWGEGKESAFCAYYLERSEGEYDLYIQGFFPHGVVTAKVNDLPISEKHVENYTPGCATTVGDGEYNITVALIERVKPSIYPDKGGDTLLVNEYSIRAYADEEITVQKRGKRLNSNGDQTYKYPLGVMHDAYGNVVVVCKLRGDRRTSSSDQGYFSWKFSNTTLEPIRFGIDFYDDRGIYMFRRFGGSAIGDPEYLLMWDDKRDFPSLSYVSRYVINRRSLFFNEYKSYDAVFFPDYKALASPGRLSGRCLISTDQCNMDTYGTVLSRKNISHVQGITIDGMRYIFYVSNAGVTEKHIAVSVIDRGIYVVIENLVRIRFPISSLNVKSMGPGRAGVMAAEKGSTRIHVYDIELNQLMEDGRKYRICAVTIDYGFMDVNRFINLASNGAQVILPHMREVATVAETVKVIRGHSVKIPVSTTKNHILNIVQYEDINYRGVSEDNESISIGSIDAGNLSADKLDAQSPAMLGDQTRMLSDFVPSTHGVDGTSNKLTSPGTPHINLINTRLVLKEKGPGANRGRAYKRSTTDLNLGDHTSTTGEFYNGSRILEYNISSGSPCTTNIPSLSNTTGVPGNSHEGFSVAANIMAMFGIAIFMIATLMGCTTIFCSWYRKNKLRVLRENHIDAYIHERVRHIADESVELIDRSRHRPRRSFRTTLPGDTIDSIEEIMAQAGCVSTQEI